MKGKTPPQRERENTQKRRALISRLLSFSGYAGRPLRRLQGLKAHLAGALGATAILHYWPNSRISLYKYMCF